MNENTNNRVTVTSLQEATDYLLPLQNGSGDNFYICPDFTVALGCRSSMQAFIDEKAPLRYNFVKAYILTDHWIEPVLNFQKVHVDAGDLLFTNWGVILQPGSVEPDVTFSGFALTEAYLHQIYGDNVPPQLAQPGTFFTVKLNDEERATLLQYLAALLRVLRLPGIDEATVRSIFLSLLNFSAMHQQRAAGAPSTGSSRGRIITDRFTLLVSQHARTRHEIDFYASELCVTPHYLGIVIKQETGETPKAWIDRHIIIGIQVALKYSNRTLAQLAREFRFSSTSSLCKFFKRKTGMTPNDYRIGNLSLDVAAQ